MVSIQSPSTLRWLVAVAAIGLWLSNPSKSVKTRLLDVAAWTAPGAAVLAALVITWIGLLPPALAPAQRDPAGLTFMFALAACYLTPLVFVLVSG